VPREGHPRRGHSSTAGPEGHVCQRVTLFDRLRERWHEICIRLGEKIDACRKLVDLESSGVPMHKAQSLVRSSVRFLAVPLGFGLISYLILRAGPKLIWEQMQAVGWGLALIIILGGFSQLIRTWSWRQTFTCDISGLSWSRSLGTQLASDALGQLGLAGKLVGEGIRISLLRSDVPLSSAISSGAIDGGLHSLTASVVAVLAITATLLSAPLSGAWRFQGLLLAFVLIAIVILAAVSVARRWPLVGNAIRTVGRLPRFHNWVTGKQPIIDSAENNLLSFSRKAPAAFWASLSLNLLWHILAVFEVYLILRFMGANIAVFSAFVLEGLTKVINLVGTLNPGNVGTYEGGNMLIAGMFGITSTTGLTLALCRRARALFWAGVGAMCLIVMQRARSAQQSKGEVICENV